MATTVADTAQGELVKGTRADRPAVDAVPAGSLVTVDMDLSRVLLVRPGDAALDGSLPLTPAQATALADAAYERAKDLERLGSELRTGCRRLGLTETTGTEEEH